MPLRFRVLDCSAKMRLRSLAELYKATRYIFARKFPFLLFPMLHQDRGYQAAFARTLCARVAGETIEWGGGGGHSAWAPAPIPSATLSRRARRVERARLIISARPGPERACRGVSTKPTRVLTTSSTTKSLLCPTVPMTFIG